MKSVIEVADEIGVIFRGRITEDTRDFENGKVVDTEGVMAYFNDSVVPPHYFPDDFIEDVDYIDASENGNVVAFFLNWLIENHNSQVQEFQQFKLGNVTVSDANNYITRSDSGISNTWEVLKSKLFDSSLGGYLCIRYEDDGNYIDYLSEFTLTNTQEIDFGKNLLALKHSSDASETCSAIIPIGAEVEIEDVTESIQEKVKVTLKSIPDGKITEDIYKITLVNGLHALYSKSVYEEYGWICAKVSETTWTDVTNAQNLLTKGVNWLSTQGMMMSDTVEITAADLYFTDKEIQSFRIYRKIKVNSLPHGLANSFDLKKLDIPLLNPQNTKITIGETKRTLTDQTSKDKYDSIQRIENAEKDIEENRIGVTEAKNQIIEQTTSILNTSEAILMNALQSYTLTGDFESYKESVHSQLSLLAELMNLKFTETIQQIINVDGDLQQKFNTITKYFTFDINGLEIGQIDSPFKVIIDNDIYRMTVNGIDALLLDPQGLSTIPELKVTKKFELFGFLIDEDEDGRVNCGYIGGE